MVDNDYADLGSNQNSIPAIGNRSVTFSDKVDSKNHDEPEPLGGEAFMGDASIQQIEDVLSQGGGELGDEDVQGEENEDEQNELANLALDNDSDYEMVEEEGEEEVEEMQNDGTKLMVKKKHMVRRMKKILLQQKDRNKGQQMPQWTEALEIEYMNKDQLNRVIDRLRKEGMSETDIKLAEDLHYKRATFSMDQYVKLSEVRQIVSEAINSILDRMGKADKIARTNRTEISLLCDKLKAQQQQVNHLKRIESGQSSLIRLQKDQQGRLAENFNALSDLKHVLKAQQEQKKLEDQDIKVQFHDINFRAQKLELQCKLTDNRMNEANEKLHEFIESSKLTFGAKMAELQAVVKNLPNELAQNVMLVENMKKDIEKKTTEQFDAICHTLALDTDRLFELEKKDKILDETVQKLSYLDYEVKKLRYLEDEMFQSNCFIERVLPLQIHHQVCEGLNIVAGADIPELLKFEKEKTEQLFQYTRQCEGIKPTLKLLRHAMENFHHHIYKSEIGSAPFMFGELKDYWPEMPERYLNAYDKLFYKNERQLPILTKIADAELERQTRLEDHTNFMIQTERDSTKFIIHQAVEGMKESLMSQLNRAAGGSGGGGFRSRGGKESSRNSGPANQPTKNMPQQQQPHRQSPTDQPDQAQPAAAIKRSSTKRKPRAAAQAQQPIQATVVEEIDENVEDSEPPNQVVTDENAVPAPLGVQTEVMNATSSQQLDLSQLSQVQLGQKAKETEEQTETRTDQLTSQYTASQYFSQMPQQNTIVYETRYVNNLHVVKQLDKEALAALKKKARKFMESGRSEFNAQLTKWIELFEETSEDQYDTGTRVQRLESIIELMQTQLETQQETMKDQEAQLQIQSDQLEGHENYLIELEEENDSQNEEMKAQKEMSVDSSDISLSGSGTSHSVSVNMNNTKKEQTKGFASPPSIALTPKRPSETPEPRTEQSDKSMIGFTPEQMGYRGTFSLRKKTSIREMKALRSKRLSQANKNVTLEPIHESIDEAYEDKERIDVAKLDSASDSQTNSSHSSKKSKLLSATEKKVDFSASTQRSKSSSRQQTPKGSSRQQRLTKLQNTAGKTTNEKQLSSIADSKKIKEIMGSSMKRKRPAKASTVTSNTSDESESSFNTVEKKDNKEADGKMAGTSFNFAHEMQRKTLSRAQLTDMIQQKFDEVSKLSKEHADAVHIKMDNVLEKEKEMQKSIVKYQEETRSSIQAFIDVQVAELKQRGFEMQERLMGRIVNAEQSVQDFKVRLETNERNIKIMTDRMQQEYNDFVQARKRWKSDFKTADNKNQTHIELVHNMISGCETQNKVNTRAIKMMLDAQMIEQLVQRQDTSDRKQLLVMAMKNNKQLMSTDGGVTAREVYGPRVDASKLKYDRNQTVMSNSPNRMRYSSCDAARQLDGNNEENVGMTEFDDNAARIDPPLLRVDRACLNCSDNKTATLNAIKVACLGYSQSPISYQGANYHVSDLLTVKGQVVAQCQRMLRDNLFQTRDNLGINIRAEDNERSYVITPLLNANPIKVATNLDDLLKSQGHKDLLQTTEVTANMGFGSTQYADGHPLQQSIGAESSIQQIREQRYSQLTPKAKLKNQCGDDKFIVSQRTDKGRHKKLRTFQQDLISSQQHCVSTDGGDDLFSSNQNLDSQSISIPPQQLKLNIIRGMSQLTQHKPKQSGARQFAHIRFASTSKIQHQSRNINHTTGGSKWEDARRSVQNCDTGVMALPDLKKKKRVPIQRNGDFENMFADSGNASTKHSNVRQNSVITGMTSMNQNHNSNLNMTAAEQKKHMIGNLSSARYRIGHSAVEDSYRGVTTTKVMLQETSRPQTQGDGQGLIDSSGVRNINSYRSSKFK